ncbi:MAG: Mur ligase domain-containing protein, partial [Flavipsychrobacter sp.]
MLLLKDILTVISPLQVVGDTSVEITGLCIDSREVVKGSVFIAVKGTVVDGHNYIERAIADGAVAIVCEVLPANTETGIAYVLVKDSASVVGLLADAFYGAPSSSMKVVGITGTNGKTTTV